ncbi:CLIPB1.2 family protein [Megaselia abdita]
MKSAALFLLILYFKGTLSQSQFGNCLTPNSERGSCIILKECNGLYSLLQRVPLNDEDKNFLKRSQCGWHNGDVLICCTEKQKAGGNFQPAVNRGPNSDNELLPEPGVCGSFITDKIYGGVETKLDEYPWMALIEYQKPNNTKGFHCGATLISRRYLITASHCINAHSLPTDWKPISVRLGEWDISTDMDCDEFDCTDPIVDVPIAKIIGHEEYDPNVKNLPNDIALLRLSRKIDYSDFIKPICLPVNPNVPSDALKMDIAGWGKNETIGNSNKKLRAYATAVSLDSCNDVYSKRGINLSNKQLCVGGDLGIGCRVDSGGLLMGLNRTVLFNSYLFIAGVFSFGSTPCGLQGWPVVYTKVSEYVDWIKRNVEP